MYKALAAKVKLAAAWILISTAVYTPSVAEEAPKLCSDLKQCLQLAAVPGNCTVPCGIPVNDVMLAQLFWQMGAPAIPGLIKLLDNPDESVRQRAGFILRSIDGLRESDLPALIEALRRGNGWIAPAIAHIGTPEAIRSLVGDLRAHPESDTQTTWALTSLGARAVPALMSEFNCRSGCDVTFFRAVASVLRDMGPASTGAVGTLVE